MYTSIFLFAVAGLVPGADLTRPSWQTDYNRARQLGLSEQKAVAVVLGPGSNGWDHLTLDDTARRLLAEYYVPVYIDTETSEGKRLATAFDMPSGQGIVLSDRRGENQAFWHEGSLTSGELSRHLQRVANIDAAARTTETTANFRTAYYPPSDPGYANPYAQGYANPYAQFMQPGNFGGAACRT